MSRIVHVVRRLVSEEWGGTEAVLYNYCSRLTARNHEVPIYTTAAMSQPGCDDVRGLAVERFKYFYPFLFLSDEARLVMDKKGGSPISLPLTAIFGRASCPVTGSRGVKVNSGCPTRPAGHAIDMSSLP